MMVGHKRKKMRGRPGMADDGAGDENHSAMAALDAGCARTTRPHWYAYPLVKGRASYEKYFTPLSFFPPSPSSLNFLLPLNFFPQVIPFINLTQSITIFISA